MVLHLRAPKGKVSVEDVLTVQESPTITRFIWSGKPSEKITVGKSKGRSWSL